MNISEVDYYNILNVRRNATKEEIFIAYRKLAVRLCPFRDPRHLRDFEPHLPRIANSATNSFLNRQWACINMACDVLGNDLRRSIYDRFGESGLLRGVPLLNGYYPPYQYHGNHMKVYHDVFGSYFPYANVIDVVIAPPPLHTNKHDGIGVRTKDSPVIKRICLDLEEVYNGCIKLMHVWRQEFIDTDELRTEKRRKTLTLNIHPGVTAGTNFCFSEEGDRYPNKIPSDIIFIVEDKPHKTFKRANQHDIIYVHEINLCQALTGFKFNINTLDKRHLKVYISDVVHHGFIKVVPGEGLPKCKDFDVCKSSTKDCGDLVIEFRIMFPGYLTTNMKELVRNCFAELHNFEQQEAAKYPICN